MCVPNEEVMGTFRRRVARWFGPLWPSVGGLMKAVLEGDPEDASRCLSTLVADPLNPRVMSNTRDLHTAHQLLVTGMLASDPDHVVRMEHHSGD